MLLDIIIAQFSQGTARDVMEESFERRHADGCANLVEQFLDLDQLQWVGRYRRPAAEAGPELTAHPVVERLGGKADGRGQGGLGQITLMHQSHRMLPHLPFDLSPGLGIFRRSIFQEHGGSYRRGVDLPAVFFPARSLSR